MKNKNIIDYNDNGNNRKGMLIRQGHRAHMWKKIYISIFLEITKTTMMWNLDLFTKGSFWQTQLFIKDNNNKKVYMLIRGMMSQHLALQTNKLKHVRDQTGSQPGPQSQSRAVKKLAVNNQCLPGRLHNVMMGPHRKINNDRKGPSILLNLS